MRRAARVSERGLRQCCAMCRVIQSGNMDRLAGGVLEARWTTARLISPIESIDCFIPILSLQPPISKCFRQPASPFRLGYVSAFGLLFPGCRRCGPVELSSQRMRYFDVPCALLLAGCVGSVAAGASGGQRVLRAATRRSGLRRREERIIRKFESEVVYIERRFDVMVLAGISMASDS